MFFPRFPQNGACFCGLPDAANFDDFFQRRKLWQSRGLHGKLLAYLLDGKRRGMAWLGVAWLSGVARGGVVRLKVE